MNDEGVRALAAFAALIDVPDFRAGETMGGERGEDGIIVMPWFKPSPVVDAFVRAAYDNVWLDRELDWPAWAKTAEARSLRDDEQAMTTATPEQLSGLLTVCIRQDRFVEGALAQAFDSGLIARIVRRAAVIVGARS